MSLAEILEQAGGDLRPDEVEAGLASLDRVDGLVVANEKPEALTEVSGEVRDAIGVSGEAQAEETVMPSSLDEDGLVTYLTPAAPTALSAKEGEAMASDLDWLTDEGRAVA